MGKGNKNKKNQGQKSNRQNSGGSSMKDAISNANVSVPEEKTIDPNKEFTGVVKFFKPDKGYGFITDEDGNDHFVHFTGITEGRTVQFLSPNDNVTFNIQKNEEGKPCAMNVKIVPGSPETDSEDEGVEQTEPEE